MYVAAQRQSLVGLLARVAALVTSGPTYSELVWLQQPTAHGQESAVQLASKAGLELSTRQSAVLGYALMKSWEFGKLLG